MNKKEFLAVLRKGIGCLSYEEQDKWLDFYSEMIDDRLEDGLTEEDAVAAIGAVEAVIEQILVQSQPEKKQKVKRELKTWQVILLIVGAPLWFSLLIAVVSIVFSVLVTVWSVVISFYATAVSLAAVGVAGVMLPLILVPTGKITVALFCLGAGLFCLGMGIIWFVGTNYLAKGAVWLCKKLFSLCFHRKEAA